LTAINALEDGFVLYDADVRLVLCNETYREIYSESADLLTPGNRFEDIIRIGAERGQYPEAVGRIDEWVAERMATHCAANTEIEQRLPNGRWLKISERLTPDGGIVGFRVDITALKQATEEAEAATISKSAFLATMSHEIRTPMTGVMGFADMLLEDPIPDESREKVHRIQDATQSLLRIINDILDMSKLDAERMEIEYLDFHMPSLITDIMSMFKEINEERSDLSVRFETDLSSDFPGSVRSDPTRLRQVLVNLVGNAAKFTSAGAVTLRGSLEKDKSGGEFIHIQVTDTGIGIAADVVDELFTDFTQADASTSRRFEGTGLGLAICRRLIELMHGEIGCNSTLGKGSTFWFKVPYVPAETDVSPSAAGNAAPVTVFETERPLRILVAEDNDINQRIIGAILTTFGHTFEMVGNGAEAVRAVDNKAEAFDLVLMDVRMPELSGPEATRHIRRLQGAVSGLPIIALTADAMAEHAADYLAAGMNAVVAKPIDRAALALTINEVLGESVHVPVATDGVGGGGGEVLANDDTAEEAVTHFLHRIGTDDA